MAFTLAGCGFDLGEIFQGLALGLAPCSVMFIGLFVGAMALSKRKWGAGPYAVIAWGLTYPFFQALQSLIFAISTGATVSPLFDAFAPTLISAGLLGWATKSFLAPAGCLVGLGLVGLNVGVWMVPVASTEGIWTSLLGVPWNLAVGAGLFVWAWRVRRNVVPAGHCFKCGYDLRGTVGKVCPECGSVKTREREKIVKM